MADEWDGLRAVFGELNEGDAEPATSSEIGERAVELANRAADELRSMARGDAEVLAAAMAAVGAGRGAASMLLSLARDAAHDRHR